jgi:hypothetical protein
MTAWRRTRDATGLWLSGRRHAAVLAAPAVFARYLIDPLAAVRALSGACHG